jgi:hypothetical protein
MSKPHWRPAHASDLPAVSTIAARIHPDLPERPEVFAEKMRLYPDGCRVLATDDGIVGYGLAHPWMQHRIPPLDGFLEQLPGDADCLYLHDIAVLPTFAAASRATMSLRPNSSRARQESRRSHWCRSTPRGRCGSVSAFGRSRRMRSCG